MPPARTPAISSFHLLLLFNPFPFFVRTQRLPLPFLPLSTSCASTSSHSLCFPRAKPHTFFSLVVARQPTLFIFCTQREPPPFLLFTCCCSSTPSLSLCATNAYLYPFFLCLLLALQLHPILCVSPAQTPTLSFLLFPRVNTTPPFVPPVRIPPFLLFSCAGASTPTLSLCAPSAKPHSFIFCLVLVLQSHSFFCVHPARTPTLSPLILFSRFNPTHFLLCVPPARTPPFLFFYCSGASTLCKPPARNPTVPSFVLFLRLNHAPLFVCTQHEPPPYLLFACSRGSISTLFCVPPARTPTLYSFLWFSRFNTSLFVCPKREIQIFLFFSTFGASNPTLSLCASSANPHPFY